jgi:hypothetical protein
MEQRLFVTYGKHRVTPSGSSRWQVQISVSILRSKQSRNMALRGVIAPRRTSSCVESGLIVCIRIIAFGSVSGLTPAEDCRL